MSIFPDKVVDGVFKVIVYKAFEWALPSILGGLEVELIWT